MQGHSTTSIIARARAISWLETPLNRHSSHIMPAVSVFGLTAGSNQQRRAVPG